MSTEGAEEEAGGRVGWGLQAFIPTWRQGRGDVPPSNPTGFSCSVPAGTSHSPSAPPPRGDSHHGPLYLDSLVSTGLLAINSTAVFSTITAGSLAPQTPAGYSPKPSHRYLSRYSRTFSDSTQPSSSCLRIALICRTCSRIFSARGSSMRSAIPWTT
ncbi:hypothetical protein DSECCO2_37720 [anaerobic digester metagenome]